MNGISIQILGDFARDTKGELRQGNRLETSNPLQRRILFYNYEGQHLQMDSNEEDACLGLFERNSTLINEQTSDKQFWIVCTNWSLEWYELGNELFKQGEEENEGIWFELMKILIWSV